MKKLWKSIRNLNANIDKKQKESNWYSSSSSEEDKNNDEISNRMNHPLTKQRLVT